jgi:hypothetical protein
MSGALNSVLGGGNILGAALNIGSMFFPPLAIANAASNLLNSVVGDAVKGAIDTISKECGMPKFIADIAKGCVDQVLPQQQQPCDRECSEHVRERTGGLFERFGKELMSDIVDAFKGHKAECDRAEGGKGGGKSWFVALMTALGEMQNKQADKLQKLQKEVSDALGSGDDSAGSKQAQFDKMEEFKAEGKLMDVLSQTVKSIGDSLGQALATVARAQ